MIKGIDISSWQGGVNFDIAKKNGIHFVFLRALFGKIKDSHFLSNLTKAQSCDILCGAYFFPIKQLDISEQIKDFIDLVSCLKLDLPPAIDVEEYLDKSLLIGDVELIIKNIEDSLGITPIIYTSYNMWNKTKGESSSLVSRCPLWLASWNTDETRLVIPSPWNSFAFWQSDVISNGSYYGTAPYNTLDIDYFNGNPDLLKNLKDILTIRRKDGNK
jgi:lysozyme